MYDSSLYFLCRNGIQFPSFLLFYTPCLPPFFFCTALIKSGFLWELLWSVVPNAKFSSSPFVHSNTINWVSFSLRLYLFRSLTPASFQMLLSCIFSFLFHRFLQEECSWRGRGGQGHGLTLGSIDDLCMCVCVFVSQGFFVVLLSSLSLMWVRAIWVGRREARSTKNNRSPNRGFLQLMHN